MTGVSPRQAAITGGAGLLLMAFLAPFANFYVLKKLIVPGDAAATAAGIGASAGLFRLAIAAFLIIAILDIVVAWALNIILQSVNKELSRLAAWLRIIYAAILLMCLNCLISVPQVIASASADDPLLSAQLYAQVMTLLNIFQSGWSLALSVFGLHLLILGWLLLRSGFFPKFLGVLVVIAGAGYLIDSFGNIAVPGYSLNIAMYTFIGEVLMIIWLFIRGIKGFKTD